MAIDYIPYLRKMVGHTRILSVGLACVIINDKEEILLEQRKDNGLFCLPGGSIDLDETAVEGVKREVLEETGIELGEVSLLRITSGKKNQLVYPNGDVTDYVDLIFYSHISLTNSDLHFSHDDESTLVKFYPLDQLPEKEKFLRGSLPPIEQYLKKQFTVVVD